MNNIHGNDWTAGSDSNRTDDYLVVKHLTGWSPTMKLRWIRTEIEFDDYDTHCEPELQQLWTDGLGKEEWRPIEFV